MVCTPTESEDVLNVAAPGLVGSSWTVINSAFPSVNVTVPVGTGLPLKPTKALKVTGCPWTAGFGALCRTKLALHGVEAASRRAAAMTIVSGRAALRKTNGTLRVRKFILHLACRARRS